MQNRITPTNITELKENQIFVFGSNLRGNHSGGAAKLAKDKFGAIEGNGIGIQGNSYAIPTMFDSIDKIKPYINYFIDYANSNKDKVFLVTEIGCGIAGFKVEEIGPLFYNALFCTNIHLPLSFWQNITIKGYKGFDKNFKCRGFEFKENDTSNLKVKNKLNWFDVLNLCNSGFNNTGNWNSGNSNSGNSNSGNRNSGDWNSGNRNSGNWNSGNSNSGNSNSGDRNSGNWNSGNSNSGDWNSGDWNSGDWNSGYFNTKTPKTILVFGIETNIEKWNNCYKPEFLYFNLTKWISFDSMSEEEKIQHPKAYVCNGYLKKMSYKEAFIESWDNADKQDRIRIKDIPNFNADMFFEISGIDVNK